MISETPVKIHTLQSLLEEKQRLQRACKYSEMEIERHFNYLREHAAELAVDHFIMPSIKKTFNIQNLLNVLSIGQLVKTFTDTEQKPTLKNLSGLFSKSGMLLAVKVGFSLLKKFL